jgi:hypothetical protein
VIQPKKLETARNSQVTVGTASAVEETVKAATETVKAAEDTARQVPKAAPETTRTVRKGAMKASKAAKATFRQAGNRLRKVAIKKTINAKNIKRSTKKQGKRTRTVKRSPTKP